MHNPIAGTDIPGPDVRGFIRETARAVDEQGISGLSVPAKTVYHKFLQQGSRLRPAGQSIYDAEWDVLIILDACRADLFRSVVAANPDRFDFIQRGQLTCRRSLESATRPWMRRTFGPDVDGVGETQYVVGNPWSAHELTADWFAELTEVWADSWDETHGTLLAADVTDAALAASEDLAIDSDERLLVHYMQPHCPFVEATALSTPKATDGFATAAERDVWERLQDGEFDSQDVWDGYRSNLLHALEEVDRLLSGIDAPNVVVTSDHGNALGEYGLYGHPESMPFDCLRTVPWLETTGEDTGEHDSDERSVQTTADQASAATVESRLEALGYK